MSENQSLIDLQDQILDFLLLYKAEVEPELTFALRKFNTRQMLEKGHWFPSSEEGDYFAVNFWTTPSLFDLRVFIDGRVGLFYDIEQAGIDPENKSKELIPIFRSFQGFEKFEYNEGKYPHRYLVRWYVNEKLNVTGRVEYFLSSLDKKNIWLAIKNGLASVYDPLASNGRLPLGLINKNEFNDVLQNVLEFRRRLKSAQFFTPITPSKPKKGEVPIALESLFVADFQGIKKTELIRLPRAPWIFLTGNNGYGKTSVLRAIFVGFFGPVDQGVSLSIEGGEILVRYWNQDQPVSNNLSETDQPLKQITGYGASRLSITSNEAKNEIAKKNTPSYSLFNSDGVLFSIENELGGWYYRDKARFKSVTECLCQIMPGIQRIFYDELSNQVMYVEEASDYNDGFVPHAFDKLASGYKSIIAIVGDMIIRFFQTNPELKKPSEIMGIVIIDELDLHLHPIWQRQLPTLLSKAFPKVQFIASTHSPIPILGAPKNSIFLRVNRTKESGITLEELDIDVSTLLPNTILTSPIFGLQDILSEAFDGKTQRTRTEKTFQELTLNDQVTDRLTAFENSEKEALLLNIFKTKHS